MLTDGNGHYYRDRKGVWRYALTGEAVPGARPRKLWEQAKHYERLAIDGAPFVAVPGADLKWCPDLVQMTRVPGVYVEGEISDTGAQVARYLVPEALFLDPIDPEGGMWAPELEPAQLARAEEVAQFMGWRNRETVQVLLCRGHMPGPVVRVRHRGSERTKPRTFWTWPILEQFRSMHGARKAAEKAERLARLAACNRAKGYGLGSQ